METVGVLKNKTKHSRIFQKHRNIDGIAFKSQMTILISLQNVPKLLAKKLTGINLQSSHRGALTQ